MPHCQCHLNGPFNSGLHFSNGQFRLELACEVHLECLFTHSTHCSLDGNASCTQFMRCHLTEDRVRTSYLEGPFWERSANISSQNMATFSFLALALLLAELGKLTCNHWLAIKYSELIRMDVKHRPGQNYVRFCETPGKCMSRITLPATWEHY